MSEALHLRPYQSGMRAFAGEHELSALFAGMGLGKTPVALHVMQDSLFDRVDIERWLVVGPRLVVADAWPRQLKRWTDFRHLTWRGFTAEDFHLRAQYDQATGRRTGLTFGERADKRAVKRELLAHREHVHLVPWHMLAWLVKACGANWPYDGVVLDESIFAANTTSDTHKAVFHVVHRLGAVKRLILLTGSPTPNGYEQLHGQVRLIEPALLGIEDTGSDGQPLLRDGITAFRERFMLPDKYNPHQGMVYSWKLAPGAKDEIDRLVAGVAISLRTEDYLDLPPCNVNPLRVMLPRAARAAYDALERDFLAEVRGQAIVAPSEASKGGKLLQMANGAVYDDTGKWHELHAAKIDRLDELAEQTPGPILLAYSFEHDWQRIKARFGKHAEHVSAPRALDKFRAGSTKLLCMHPASGAHGLDGLQEVSSEAVWFGATYNADHWLQFNKRLHRDGQRAGRVTINQIIADDTIEEYVAGRVIPEKVTVQDLFLEAIRYRQNSHAG